MTVCREPREPCSPASEPFMISPSTEPATSTMSGAVLAIHLLFVTVAGRGWPTEPATDKSDAARPLSSGQRAGDGSWRARPPPHGAPVPAHVDAKREGVARRRERRGRRASGRGLRGSAGEA